MYILRTFAKKMSPLIVPTETVRFRIIKSATRAKPASAKGSRRRR